MLTKEQALTADDFHENGCVRIVGPRGGVTVRQYKWRRNGRTQLWKTRPDDFRTPIKWGLRMTSQLTPSNAHEFHMAADCPLNQPGPVG
jgi:hypothetical protein